MSKPKAVPHPWEVTDSEGKVHHIPPSVIRYRKDGSLNFTDGTGLLAHFPPGVVRHARRADRPRTHREGSQRPLSATDSPRFRSLRPVPACA